MDNILKYLLGVLGIAALIALAIPDSTSDQEITPVVPAPVTVKPAKAPTPFESSNANQPSNKDEGSDDWDEEYENFGQPMNDAVPLGTDSSDGNNGEDPSINNGPESGPMGSPNVGGARAPVTSNSGQN